MDLWLISRIKRTIENAIKNFNDYNYSSALDIIESFFWNDFCDKYLEIVKARTYGLNFLTYSGIDVSTISQEEQTKIVKGQQSAIRTIYYVFNAVLKLFAPFMPAICDEIYSCVYEDEFNKTKSISSRGNFAKVDDFVENEEIERIGQVILDVVANVRKEKSEKNISIKEMIEEITISSEFNDKIKKDVDLLKDIKNVCNVKNIIFK